MDIIVENLSKSYNDAGRPLCVIDNLSAHFLSGRSYSIVGRSGIGKSTLLHLIGALDAPQSGSVRYGDTDVVELSPDRRAAFRGGHVGFIFQFHQLLAEFDAVENVAMPCIIAGEAESIATNKAKEILSQVGLAHRGHHRPGELSGGEQQRVAIARALVRKPAIVLADEPTGNLDSQTAGEIQELLLGLQQRDKMTLVVVTHSKDLATATDFAMEMLPGGSLAPLTAALE